MKIDARVPGLLALLSLAACASNETRETSSSCSVGDNCKLVGTLTILRGTPASVGVLKTETGCVPLALPPEIYSGYQRWNDKRVVIAGESFAHGFAENVLSVELKDRQVAAGGCDASPMVIYVNEIDRL